MPCWIAAQRLPPHPVVLSSGAHCNKKAREQKPLKVNCVQVPNPSPTNPLPKRAGPSPGSSAEKTAKPAPAPVQGGSDKKKTLSSEAISGLKGQIAEGLQQVNQNKKDSRKANQSAAKAAAQALSASLPTRCTGVPKESKGKGTEVTKVKGARAKDAKPKRKMRKAERFRAHSRQSVLLQKNYIVRIVSFLYALIVNGEDFTAACCYLL